MKVSIIIPYKEDRGFLDACLRSIDAQTYKNFEVIESKSDAGVSENLNNGIKRATGDLIRYVCDDDMLTRDSLFETVTNWRGDWDFIHSNAVSFNSQDPRLRSGNFPRITKPTLADMAKRNELHGGSVVYHARCFENDNLFDQSLWTGEEYEFNMRLLKQRRRLGYINAFTYLYRRHEKQKSVGLHGAEYQQRRFHAINEIKERFKNK